MGPGALNQLADEVTALKANKVLIVTDQGLIEAGLVKKAQNILAKADIKHAVFGDVEADPRYEIVADCVEMIRRENADLLIGFGGGSPIDIAKISAVMAKNDGPLAEYFGLDLIPNPGLPTIIVPTTAGTASEVTPIVILSDEEAKLKRGIVSAHLQPSVALLDPELTIGLPPHITAATGMDALSHNLEAYLARGFHPLADAIAIRGISLVARFLPRAVSQGADDLEARTAMMSASLMGAVAFQKGLGGIHSLAHALGSECNLHHGLANALVMPAMLRFNAEAVPGRMQDVATALGASGAGYGADPGERAAQRVEELNREIGLPASLVETGVSADQKEAIVAAAHADACHQSNPRPVTRSDFVRIIDSLFAT